MATDSLRDDFGIEARRVSLLASHSFDTLFRADLTAGKPIAVRVGEVRIHTDGVEEVEAAWLDALHADTEIQVPRLLADRHGQHVAAGHHADVPGPRYCSAMTWVPGRTVRECFDHATSQQMGALLANIHEQAASYQPPDAPAGMHADRVVYFANTSRLGEYESAYRSMFVEAVDEVQRHLDALWAAPPHRPHLLHGDFGPQNVMRWTTQLTPIDFQDLQFGFNVQDVGITVADLRRQYADESLVEIFVKGYRSVRPWPLTDQLLEQSTRRGAEPERDQPRPELATAILRELDFDYARICSGKFPEVADEWEAGCATIGRNVTVQIGGRKISGRAEALDDDGALLVRTEHGRLERIIGGDVTLEK